MITTNVDGQFLKAGFNKDRVFEVQGSLSKIQCSKACHNKLYDDLDMVEEMLNKDEFCKIPTELVPYCPKCGEKMDINLRKDNYFVEDSIWHKLNKLYNKFINDYKDKKLLLIELGVGYNTPGIIRFPFEEMVMNYKDTYLIRINDKYNNLMLNIKDKVIVIKDDCSEVINMLNY